MEIKTNAEVLLEHWLQFSSIAQNGEDGKVLKVEKSEHCFHVWTQYNSEILTQTVFHGKIHLTLSCEFLRNVVAFESSAKFCSFNQLT